MVAAAAAAASGGWRTHFQNWWLGSSLQRTWLRLAIQTGVCTLLIMCIFSAPAVWNLHTFDPILANPVLVLVIANLGLLFTVNTGLPALKICLEAIVGTLGGGVAVWAVTYTAYGINGGSHANTVTKAAMTLLFGSLMLMLGTASRFRWPQHVGLAGIFFNLTVAVGCAVCYKVTHDIYRFVLYWWWFIGLAVIFLAGVATLVLPLPAGWVVRKQLARALRQEGRVVEAIVQLITAEDPTACLQSNASSLGKASASPESAGTQGGGGGGSTADLPSLGASGGNSMAPVRGGVLFPDFMTLGEGADSWSTAAHWPAAAQEEPSRVGEALSRLWHGAGAGGRKLGRGLSRLGSSLRSSRNNLGEAAAAMGIHPDLYTAVEPVYAMSGPTAASMQAAWAHMRFTHFEIDLYRPTHIFPLLAFQRVLLLARTLLSAAMMMLYPLQAGKARLGASRRHAPQMRQVAVELKRCCQGLAAVLRDNAPVGPSVAQLERLEAAFWELQQEVGEAAVASAAAHSASTAAAAEAAVEQLIATERQDAGGDAAEAAAMNGFSEQAAETAAAAGAATGDGAQEAEDSLALHLSLSMLFTCCTRVRSMYQLLPQLVARDQEGVGEAVAAHFATAHAWDHVLRARTYLEPKAASPRGADEVFRRSQALWGSTHVLQRSARSSAALDKLERPTVQLAERITAGRPEGWLAWAAGHVRRVFAVVEKFTGFTRNQIALGIQMAVSFSAVMFLVFVPAANDALGGRAVWAVFIIVVVHEPLLGSVIWKCFLRFGGTVVAGLLGLGSLYFAVLCNGLSFENHPPKFIAMTAALTLLTMPLAAGTARYGLHNAYFWVVSCLIMYTVALPGYAYESPMPILALWRLTATAIGLAIELVAAIVVFPVTAREAAHAVVAGALRGMADVADTAFHSVLKIDAGGVAAVGQAGKVAGQAVAPPPEPSAPLPAVQEQPLQQQPLQQQQQQPPQQPQALLQPVAVPNSHAAEAQQPHAAVTLPGGGWHGREVAQGAVLTRIHQKMMDSYGRITTFRALLVPLRVEYHPFKEPTRFPTRPGRGAQRLCRRMLNMLTTFAITMDAHHTESVPLLEPHAAELEGLIAQLSEALRALGAMVAGTVSLESAARTVAALEQHAQHLMLRVLLSGPPNGLSPTDATQGLAFLAMLFNVTSVARLLCLSLGETFCAADVEGQAAAAALLRDSTRWAADDRLMAIASELVSEALVSVDEEAPAPGAAPAQE